MCVSLLPRIMEGCVCLAALVVLFACVCLLPSEVVGGVCVCSEVRIFLVGVCSIIQLNA